MNQHFADPTEVSDSKAAILAQREALDAASPSPSGVWPDKDGNPVMVAPNEYIALEWRKALPGYRVEVAQPLPTGGNPPHRKGRPEGLL